MTTTVNDIRRNFLSYFECKDHRVQPSSPLVPQNDPTLMFTNAGMVPFKHIFTGAETPPAPRATTSQKCVRAGGKHNDLDNVGYTARHHTFFEMLGNFSFGDYFKESAIAFAWELLTKDFGLPQDKLFVTVYHTDDEAFELWRKISRLPESKILRVPTNDNFWSMGDTGPCGPCSEVFYDHGEGIEGKWALDKDGSDLFEDRFIEIWNLVFMQYEQVDSETRIDLPKPSIDTGMGLERIAAVLQGVHDNYDTDLFVSLIDAAEDAVKATVTPTNHASFKVIADHLRSSCFLMADGVTPSNEGRGYVLRRIMRRAMRHAHILGSKDPLMHRLVPSLIHEMGAAYPELGRAEALMTETLKNEETRFRETLARGLHLLEEETGTLASGKALPGDVAFKLYDTYGFPVDLTADILRGQGREVDMAGFDAAMAEQKARARAAWSGSGGKFVEQLWYEISNQHGKTNFTGYEELETIGKILTFGDPRDFRAETDEEQVVGQFTAAGGVRLEAGEPILIITDRTPFYGESGGQIGDQGVISVRDENGAVIKITDTQKPIEDIIVHYGTVVQSGLIYTNVEVTLSVEVSRRNRLRANHSATHLLHKALRDVLGEHVTQQGSLVAEDKLRFDISHAKPLTAEKIQQVERRVNHMIWSNSEVNTRISTPEEAQKAGALALFGEKYGDEVRVVSMGVQGNGDNKEGGQQADPALSSASCASQQTSTEAYSIELCGGTHVARTGDIGLFKITEQSAVAAGVRRLEAVTGDAAFIHLTGQEARLRQAADALKTSPAELPERVRALVAERKQLERQLADVKKQLALGGSQQAANGADNAVETIGNTKFMGKIVADIPAKELKGMADSLKKQLGSGVVALLATDSDKGKLSIVVGVTDDLTGSTSAVELVKAASEAAGGKGGGGRPDMAQAGSPDAGKAADALAAVRQRLAS